MIETSRLLSTTVQMKGASMSTAHSQIAIPQVLRSPPDSAPDNDWLGGKAPDEHVPFQGIQLVHRSSLDAVANIDLSRFGLTDCGAGWCLGGLVHQARRAGLQTPSAFESCVVVDIDSVHAAGARTLVVQGPFVHDLVAIVRLGNPGICLDQPSTGANVLGISQWKDDTAALPGEGMGLRLGLHIPSRTVQRAVEMCTNHRMAETMRTGELDHQRHSYVLAVLRVATGVEGLFLQPWPCSSAHAGY